MPQRLIAGNLARAASERHARRTLAKSYAQSGLAKFGKRLRHKFVDRKQFRHAGDGMPRAPDVLPALWPVLARADVDVLADIDGAALGKVVGIEAGGLDRRTQH